tara:strand:+ start:3736 stop:4314 length:579 start_codon:yes stop_codon:yes gene_type:complete
MMAALARRLILKNTPNTTMSWAMSDEGDPSIIMQRPQTGVVTRYFERVNGTIRLNLEFSHYLTHVGCLTHPETDLPKTFKYQYQGRNFRDVFRSYLSPHGFQTLLTLYFHHLPRAAAIRNSWEEADFEEYYITADPMHPRSFPLFDYGYMEHLTKQLAVGIVENSIAERRNNGTSAEFEVLPFPTIRGDKHG